MVDDRFIIPDLPEVGSQEWENMVDVMRDDISLWEQQAKDRKNLILVARKMLKAQGRDFDAEYLKWKEAKDG